jgi:N-acetylneuraminic acid mutarotase
VLALFLAMSCLIVVKPAFSSSAVPAENTWTQKAPMQVARSNLGVAVVNNRIYAIGGSTVSGYSPDTVGTDYNAEGWIVDTNEEYDPQTDKWTFKAAMPTPRYGFAIAVYKNKIYCMGGTTNYKVGYYSNLTQANEVYDPATDSWESKSPIPKNAGGYAHVIGSKIYLVRLGYPDGTYNDLRVYDPATDTWSIKTPMPPPPKMPLGFASAVVDNKIYAMYGFYNSASDAYESKTEIYDPSTDRWSSGAPVPLIPWIEAAGATTGIMAPKRIYVFGLNESIPTKPELARIVQVYNPEYDYWINSPDVPTNRVRFGVAVLNDTLFVVGGQTFDYVVPLSDQPQYIRQSALNEQYVPFGHGTPDPSYVPPNQVTPPEIAVLSPENTTYNGTSVSLVFEVDKQTSWLGYSLDGQENVTITGNVTLSGLSSGMHNVTVYARDEFDNTGASETIIFTVDVPEPFPTTLVAAVSGVSIAVVGAGLLVYFKKRKQ